MTNLLAVAAAAVMAMNVALLGGCAARTRSAGPPQPVSTWAPSTRPAFTTLDRSTIVSLVHDGAGDLLTVRDPLLEEPGAKLRGHLTWLVRVPGDLQTESPTPVDGERVQAWLLEELPGLPTHVAPARGEVTLHSRSTSAVEATIRLVARGAEPRAGDAGAPAVTLSQRMSFEASRPFTTQYPGMSSRSGVEGDALPTKRR
ncbi:MAG: hypothetical protein SFZ24_00925 [Planctomycetota bacterium]|nr:hypothetical protein [Planctomycetota bacterium]